MELKSHRTSLWVRGVLALAALALSLSLHAWAIFNFPELPIGKSPDVDLTKKSYATVMDRVELEPQPGMSDRPESFSLDHPALSPLREVKSEALSTPWVPALQATEAVIANAQTADVSADQLPNREGWSPRQQVMDIDHRLFSDEVSTLPRRLSPDIPREADAPDWSPPSNLDESGRFNAPQAPGSGLSLQGVSGLGDYSGSPSPDGWLDSQSTGDLEMLDVDLIEESSEVLDETPEEISQIEALETLLKVELKTEKISGDPYTYFELQIRRAGAEALPVIPKDVMIIQDASKSMSQKKLDRCIEGVYLFLEELNSEDRFNIVTFRDDLDYAFPDWQSYKGQTIPKLRFFLDPLKASGKTDVSGTLDSVMQLKRTESRPIVAVLVTDGRPTQGLVDTSDIIVHLSEANKGNVSVFALGGGQNVNRFLLDMLSYKNRGDSFVVPERDDIPSAMRDWAKQLQNPVLTDLSFRFSGIEDEDVFPKALTHLFLDRPLTLYGRSATTDQSVAFRIEGENGEENLDIVFELNLNRSAPSNSGSIREQWAWQKSLHLIGQHVLTDDDQVLEAIRALRKSHEIDIPYGREWLPFGF